GSGSIRVLACNTCRDRAAFHQRLKRGHALEARVSARRFVSGEVTDRRNLTLEIAVVDGMDRPPVGFVGEMLHLVARDLPLVGDHLGGAKLVYLFRAVARLPAR